jgi:hypothetical protein
MRAARRRISPAGLAPVPDEAQSLVSTGRSCINFDRR